MVRSLSRGLHAVGKILDRGIKGLIIRSISHEFYSQTDRGGSPTQSSLNVVVMRNCVCHFINIKTLTQIHVCLHMLQHVQVQVPSPKKNEVLIKVQAVSINLADWHIQNGLLRPFVPRFPFIPGIDASVIISSVLIIQLYNIFTKFISNMHVV
jgi:hypothetical protein